MNSKEEQIIELLNQGYSYSTIQKQLQVSAATIAKVKREIDDQQQIKNGFQLKSSSSKSGSDSDTIIKLKEMEIKKELQLRQMAMRETKLKHSQQMEQIKMEKQMSEMSRQLEDLREQNKRITQNNKTNNGKNKNSTKISQKFLETFKENCEFIIEHNGEKFYKSELDNLQTEFIELQDELINWANKYQVNHLDYPQGEIIVLALEELERMIKLENKNIWTTGTRWDVDEDLIEKIESLG